MSAKQKWQNEKEDEKSPCGFSHKVHMLCRYTACSPKWNNEGDLKMEPVEMVIVMGYGNNASLFAFHCKEEIILLSIMDFCTINRSNGTEVT